MIQASSARALKAAPAEVKDQDFESYIDAAGNESTIDISASQDMNGEQVRNSMEDWRIAEALRAGVTGLAFCMAVIGLWGDGIGVRAAAAVVPVSAA